MIKVITSNDCPVCETVKEYLANSKVEYIDVNSPEAQQYNPTEVPLIFVNNKRYKINGMNKKGDLVFSEID